MLRQQGRRSHPRTSGKFERLAQVAADFTSQTRVVENTVHANQEEWRLSFDNGHTIVVGSDGSCKILSS